jgi:maltokinase
MAIEDALAPWLANQRWFAGKGQGPLELAIVADTEIVAGTPELRHLIVAVSHSGAADYYQVFVGLRYDLPDRLEHVRIGPAGDGRIAYDALHDAELTRPLLAAIAGQESAGPLRMRRAEGAVFQTGLDSLVLSAEQSNTSLVFGDESILKVFRRLSPGPNPDLEVTTALTALGSSQVAPVLGWVETSLEGVPTSLAILSRFLRLASDGWSLAAASVRDLYAVAGADGAHDASAAGPVRPADAGGDFAAESRRLGVATARVHADLATAFGAGELGPEAVDELTEQMFRKLDVALHAVPELVKYSEMISEAYAELARVRGRWPVQRVHGDYHLGQVMRTENGWVVLDFEGEPATPLAQRRARSSPLRDVAGMLRSFDYAARHQLVGHPDQAARGAAAREWVRRNADAFCAGYAAGGGLDPAANQVLLRALQLDKAVYEVLYEARHRPSWLSIPLDSLAEF